MVVHVQVVTVFADGPDGGNPAPVVRDAGELNDGQMQDIARSYGLESAFVVDPAETGCDIALRFWVPGHEMSMCGHATVGAVWLLAHDGSLPRDGGLRVHTASGVVRARVDAGEVMISQPAGVVDVIDRSGAAAVLDVLGISGDQLADRPLRNSTTSRTKTLVPIRDVETLDALTPRLERVQSVCDAIGSTGIYPYAISGERRFDARQFPRSSGYPEDPATGIAAAALLYGLLAEGLVERDGQPVTVRQGRAMGRPSGITLRFDDASDGCWLGGPVSLGGA